MFLNFDRPRPRHHNRIPSRFLTVGSLTHRLHIGAHIQDWYARLEDFRSLCMEHTHDRSHVILVYDSLRLFACYHREMPSSVVISCNELERVLHLQFFR